MGYSGEVMDIDILRGSHIFDLVDTPLIHITHYTVGRYVPDESGVYVPVLYVGYYDNQPDEYVMVECMIDIRAIPTPRDFYTFEDDTTPYDDVKINGLLEKITLKNLSRCWALNMPYDVLDVSEEEYNNIVDCLLPSHRKKNNNV